jgi:2-dehydro-3-deoxy-D-arabinonate dehydratase
MYLTRHQTPKGPRWACDGSWLPDGCGLELLLSLPRSAMFDLLADIPDGDTATGTLLAPVESGHEVWASGVTYLRSREARRAESATASIYDKVYEAQRPELFFKASGWRVAGTGEPVRIRQDSGWNVPEPEMTLVINRCGEIVGYCAGNDMSSRDIEGENPLYLPQAKVYNGSCALGPGIALQDDTTLRDLSIGLAIIREGALVFSGEACTSEMKRDIKELVEYLCRELDFPHGTFLMTGTCLVPPADFTLCAGDLVRVEVGELLLENFVG